MLLPLHPLPQDCIAPAEMPLALRLQPSEHKIVTLHHPTIRFAPSRAASGNGYHKGTDLRRAAYHPAANPRFDAPMAPAAHSPRPSPRRLATPSLARPAQRVLDGIRVVRDYGQKRARRSVRLRAALFPVPHRRRREPEPRGEFRLAQAKLSAQSSYVDHGPALDANHRDPNRYVLPAGPRHRLLDAANESAAGNRVSRGLWLFDLVPHHLDFSSFSCIAKRASAATVSGFAGRLPKDPPSRSSDPGMYDTRNHCLQPYSASYIRKQSITRETCSHRPSPVL